MTLPELPRDAVPEIDAAADAQRRAARAERETTGVANVVLYLGQWLLSFGVGYWAVAGCARPGDALPFLAGFGLTGALVAGQLAAMALCWVALVFELPRLWRWSRAPVGTPLPASRVERWLQIAMAIVGVGTCLLHAAVLAGVMNLLLPSCSAWGVWWRVLGAAALISIPTPWVLRSGVISGRE